MKVTIDYDEVAQEEVAEYTNRLIQKLDAAEFIHDLCAIMGECGDLISIDHDDAELVKKLKESGIEARLPA